MQIGDVVYLKSGSRPMTIVNQPQAGKWECAWEGGSTTYPEAALTLVDPRPAITDVKGGL